MERRYQVRYQEMLAECETSPALFQGSLERLRGFAEPFVSCLQLEQQVVHARTYVAGLLSNLERKNIESIAYRDDQGRRNLQHFIGVSEWDHRPLQQELARQVGEQLGEEAGVLVIDPSGFAKKGTKSVGVARQWCGRQGKVDNCQLAVYLGYVSRQEHVLVDVRLYLPREWTRSRRRCQAAGVPRDIRFQTRHELALEMIRQNGVWLPHAWIAGDDEFGRAATFRRDLQELGERYLLAVPSNTNVRDLEIEPPAADPRAHRKVPFCRADAWAAAQPDSKWTSVTVRDGEKGPLEVEVIRCRVKAKLTSTHMPYDEVLVVTRCLDERGATKVDYYLSNASPPTPLRELARVAKAEHRIEDCIKRGKSEAGLADYEVQKWAGWHHHQILSLIAGWFLIEETRRGKKNDAGLDRATSSPSTVDPVVYRIAMRHARTHCPSAAASTGTQRASSLLSPQST